VTELVSRLRQLAVGFMTPEVAPGWYLFYFLLGLTAGRALLYDLGPFSLPLVVVAAALPSCLFWSALGGVILGLVSRPCPHFVVGVGGDLLAVTAVAALALRGRMLLEDSWLSAALLAGGGNLIVKYGYLLLVGEQPGFLPGLLSESLLAGAFVLPLSYVLSSYRTQKGLSFCLLFVFAIFGLGDLRIGPAVLGEVLRRGLLLFVAGWYGAGWGAGAGVVLGMLSGNLMVLLPRTGFYAATGFFSGLLKDCGQIGVVIGFLLSSLLFSAFYLQPGELGGHFAESSLAVLLFLVSSRFLPELFGQKQDDDWQPAMPLHAEIGFAQRPRFAENICGDSLGVAHLVPRRRLLLTVSDGMGAGVNAARESRIVIKLMEQLLGQELALDAAAEVINTALYLRGGEESAATIDAVVADLDGGSLEFLKVGAPPSFLKRGNQVELIRSVCWPAGILDELDTVVLKRRLLPGDILVMATDGITEAKQDDDGSDCWLYDYLSGLPLEEAQVIADLILKHALKLTGYENRDDMTVVVARFCSAGELE